MDSLDQGAELPRGGWRIPDDAAPYKRTPSFDQASVPAALLRAHNTKAGVWGELVVLEGTLVFVSLAGEGQAEDQVEALGVGRHGLIEPLRQHRVELRPGARFFVVFHR